MSSFRAKREIFYTGAEMSPVSRHGGKQLRYAMYEPDWARVTNARHQVSTPSFRAKREIFYTGAEMSPVSRHDEEYWVGHDEEC